MDKANLTCPYTGNEMVVAECDDLRDPGFYLKGGFDPELPFLSEEAAIKALRRRKGKDDAVTRLVCPYTGKPLQVIHRNGPNLWQVAGEFFSPSKRYQYKEDLLYDVSIRGGRKPKFERPERTRVEVKEDFSDQSDPTEGLTVKSDEVEHGLSIVLGD